jgi:hypothetical protein
MMAVSLAAQLLRYGAQAEAVEQWKIDHVEAMHCRNIEEIVRTGLSALADMRRLNEEWAKDIETGTSEFSWEEAQEFAECYRRWLGFREPLLRMIDACEAKDFSVEGADDFRVACREVALMCLDVERVRESIAALDAGRGIPFDQAMYALRNPLR